MRSYCAQCTCQSKRVHADEFARLGMDAPVGLRQSGKLTASTGSSPYGDSPSATCGAILAERRNVVWRTPAQRSRGRGLCAALLSRRHAGNPFKLFDRGASTANAGMERTLRLNDPLDAEPVTVTSSTPSVCIAPKARAR